MAAGSLYQPSYADKRLIANPNDRIRLDDYVSKLLRQTLQDLDQKHFSANGPTTKEEFASRLQRYEDAIADIQLVGILLARWGQGEQLTLLEKIIRHIAEAEKASSGTIVWLRLAWYPVLLLMYAIGISALANSRFDALRAALLIPIHAGLAVRSGGATAPLVVPVVNELTEIVDTFKLLPDMEQKYVARSEHIFKKLQPPLEDQLLLGRTYENLFDEFEILLALSYADLRDDDVSTHVWGPPGRFAWKERGRSSDPVYSRFVATAKSEGGRWGPLSAGFFKQSTKRFSDVADAYGKLLMRINWW